ncbi:MAG TPA: 50S ribosomal protein L10 [Chloroflexota bacterium]|nr:50S ribosomal protein L10 [Chloroflexota bacterium]
MPTEAKARAIDDIAQKLRDSKVAIFTNYRGLTVKDIADLRNRLRPANVKYEVVKNTLTRFAAQKADISADLSSVLEGPTAIAFGHDDVVQAAKAVNDYARTSRVFEIKAGLLENRVLSAAEITSLASLPAKPQLQAQVLGTMTAPIQNLLGVLNAASRDLLSVLVQRQTQLEKAA